ncbi:MAG: hypothetical protein KJ726_09015 [Verrucomicrobia bacterium]|nr:hypothetical protein [Verrucomicrobiota bacterium]MBU1910176.1 hypothetical protein [Verrucomicrobiota bacterium]
MASLSDVSMGDSGGTVIILNPQGDGAAGGTPGLGGEGSGDASGSGAGEDDSKNPPDPAHCYDWDASLRKWKKLSREECCTEERQDRDVAFVNAWNALLAWQRAKAALTKAAAYCKHPGTAPAWDDWLLIRANTTDWCDAEKWWDAEEKNRALILENFNSRYREKQKAYEDCMKSCGYEPD